MVLIKEATANDAAVIQQLAEIIWRPTYLPILGEEQVAYMLGLFYNTDKLSQQITDREQTYLMLYEDDKAVAFASYAPRPEQTSVYKLHKIYCLPETQGKGYGKLLLQEVEKAMTSAGVSVLELNVNRYNPAIGFYEKSGFSVAYTEDINIGNGYWMNDYVMRKLI